MAARKKTSTRKKPQYVRANKRKGADSSLVARRVLSIGTLVLIIGAIIFGVALGFRWMGRKLFSENPRFEIHQLVISCDGKLSEDYIRSQLDLTEGMNLWAFSFAEIQEKLEGASRIESVFLQRDLPDTLIVKVKERVPVARIMIPNISTKFPYTLDRFGYVLPPRMKSNALPLIQGLDPEVKPGDQITHPDIDAALRIIGMCESDPYLRDYIALETIDLQYSDYIVLHLNKGTRANISRHSLPQRLAKLASLINVASSRGQRVKSADVTLDSIHVPTVYY